MISAIKTAGLSGIQGEEVFIEVDISRGLPMFNIVGLGDTAVKEATDRVRSAIMNSGYEYPKNRITVNLSPAWIHKKGSHFDMGIAVGILASGGTVCKKAMDYAYIGELGLNGDVLPVRGILPMAWTICKNAGRTGVKGIFVAKENCKEGALACRDTSMEILPVECLSDIINHINSEKKIEAFIPDKNEFTQGSIDLIEDFKDVKGLWNVKEAIVAAIAGGHAIMLMGPPGVGKSMIAKRIPGILPPLSPSEQIETTMVYSLLGEPRIETSVVFSRPFRRISQRDTPASILGGGNEPLPGEVSLAHNGVLFADEFLELGREKTELLRKPMEEKVIKLNRRGKVYTFPADFILVAATNPCKCGYYGDESHNCTCSLNEITAYRSRLSGPMTERIDMCVEVSRIDYKVIKENNSMSTEEMRMRVITAREIQKNRFKGENILLNSRMGEGMIREYCMLDKKTEEFMKKAYNTYKLSPRRYFKILKVARTLADTEPCNDIKARHIASALAYTRIFDVYDKE